VSVTVRSSAAAGSLGGMSRLAAAPGVNGRWPAGW
jgi:hypothetical protein